MRVDISNWRWKGTPFYLRTGKRMRARMSEIVIQFREVPHSIFDEDAGRHANVLVIRLQPDEGMDLRVTIKEPGPGGMRLVDVPLDMTFAEALGPDAQDAPDAYERLIMDVIRGNQTLFMRGDEVEAAWAWTDPIIEAWTDRRDTPHAYDPGLGRPCRRVDADASRRAALAGDRMMRQLVEYPDRDVLMLDLADRLTGELADCLRRHEAASFCVPGGTTPGPIFDVLSEQAL